MNYNSDYTGMSIVTIIIVLLFSYIKIYRGTIRAKNEDIKYESLLEKVKLGYFIGIVFFIFPIFIKAAHLSFLYRGKIKNFYLFLFEYLLAGTIILFVSGKGTKLIKNINNN